MQSYKASSLEGYKFITVTKLHLDLVEGNQMVKSLNEVKL